MNVMSVPKDPDLLHQNHWVDVVRQMEFVQSQLKQTVVDNGLEQGQIAAHKILVFSHPDNVFVNAIQMPVEM